MSERWKISGKTVAVPRVSSGGSPEAEWKFQVRPGGWCVAERTRPDGSVERQRLQLAEVRGRLSVWVQGQVFQGEIQKVSARGSAGEGVGGAGGGESDLVAQFPGKVRKLLVKEGASVTAGEKLILVEAMKMEFAIQAPANGKVTKILVQEGAPISPGDRLADFEVTSS